LHLFLLTADNNLFEELASNMVYATTHATIAVMDLRTMRMIQVMENPRHYGPITTLCIDRRKAWLIVGTITGVLTLWDLRFGLLIKSWRAGMIAPGRCLRIHKCIVHPTKGRGRWVMVALEARPPAQGSASPVNSRGTILVEVWDVETTTLVETFETREAVSNPPISAPEEATSPDAGAILGQDAEKNPAAAIASFVRSRTAVQDNGNSIAIETESSESSRQTSAWTQPDVCAMIGGADFAGLAGMPRSEFNQLDGAGEAESSAVKTGGGYILTGSEDRKIRLWDLSRTERSVVLTGGEIEGEKATFT
jgi:phosphoinositide-3-kinase, regulatory subunit 4